MHINNFLLKYNFFIKLRLYIMFLFQKLSYHFLDKICFFQHVGSAILKHLHLWNEFEFTLVNRGGSLIVSIDVDENENSPIVSNLQSDGNSTVINLEQL